MTTTISGDSTGTIRDRRPLPAGPQPPGSGPRVHHGTALSYVAETGDGCRIYRQTSGLYVVYADSSDRPVRTAATLACAYAACQEIAGAAG
ncbi:MAG: hypothetical protein AB1Z22_09520 [Synechococcaceae cyanobacterium]